MYAEGTSLVSSFRNSLVTALGLPVGETIPCTEFNVVLGSGQNAAQLTMPALPGGILPSGWRVYRGSAVGSETLLATLPGDVSAFIDDGSFTPGATVVPSVSSGNLGALPTTSPAPTSTPLNAVFLDQQFIVNNGTEKIAYDQSLAQPFIPNHTNIAAFDLPLSIVGAPTGNLLIQIFPATYNQPGNTTAQNFPNTQNAAVALASLTIPMANVQNFSGTAAYTRLTLASSVSLTPGTAYYFVLSLDTSANTVASGNYVTIAGRVGSGNLSLTTCYNNYFFGARTVFSTGAWTSANQNTALNYKIYAVGVMSMGTYYYRVSAVTGWVPKQTLTYYYENVNNLNLTTIFYSSGAAGTENLYIGIGQGGSDVYQNINLYLLEHFDQNTHLLTTQSGALFTNNTALTDSSTFYNTLFYALNINTGSVSGGTNATYRLHLFLDHIFLSVSGDSTVTNFQESASFAGKAVSLNATDKCYVITSPGPAGSAIGTANWQMLRDFNNAVNQRASVYFPLAGNPTILVQGDTTDAFPYNNKYTANYDGVKLYIGDQYGIRASIPDILLYPSSIINVVNNHDTFTVGTSTYKFFKINNLTAFGFGLEGAGGYYLYRNFYPAANMS
jgi:hypothetical protein